MRNLFGRKEEEEEKGSEKLQSTMEGASWAFVPDWPLAEEQFKDDLYSIGWGTSGVIISGWVVCPWAAQSQGEPPRAPNIRLAS